MNFLRTFSRVQENDIFLKIFLFFFAVSRIILIFVYKKNEIKTI